MKRNFSSLLKTRKGGKLKWAPALSRNADFRDDESKKSVSNMVESMESGEILSSRSEWNLGLDE